MKKTPYTLIVIPVFLLSFCLRGQNVVYVAENGSGNGTSWATPAGNLKAVLEAAIPGTQIWVKEGTYRPTHCNDCSIAERNQFFQIPNGVKLYGGFAGGESSLSQRNAAAHPTYLSGDIDGDGTLANNSFTVVFTKNVSNLTVVDGFIITGGNADQAGAGLGTPQTSGAGWYNLGSTPGASSHPVIANCRFTGNYAWGYGGGLYNDGSFGGACSPTLIQCDFTNNTAHFGGGALFNTGSFNGECNPVLLHCQFTNNTCEQADGGALFNVGADGGVCNPSVTFCHFSANVAANEGGALFNFGKAGTCSPTIRGCIFEKNKSAAGGAVYNDGTFAGFAGGKFIDCYFYQNYSSGAAGALYNSGYQGTCNPELMNCSFENNQSDLAGGALFNNGIEGVSNPVITNCRFKSNTAGTYGGVMYNQGKTGNASPAMTNCIFEKNSALSAGAIYNLGAENGNANAVITNCTFYGNQANIGGAVYCNAGEMATGTCSPTLSNCIFWNNSANEEGDVFRIIWGTPTVRFSLVDETDCNSLYNGHGGMLDCSAGMIFNQNPKFVNPEGGNFHLNGDSPAIDQGLNDAVAQAGVSIDLDSLPRIFNSIVDMGVFEFGSVTNPAPAITQHPASLMVCKGEAAVFSVSATGAQPLVFQWLKNGVAMSGQNQNILTIANAGTVDAATYACAVTNSTGDTVLSNEATLTVQAPATVGLAINASKTHLCQGEEIVLTATPVNGGAAPFFQWFINGWPFGGSIQSFAIGNLNDGDTFTCSVTSSETCVVNPVAQSNPLAVRVDSFVMPAIFIASSTGSTFCLGDTVTFTANTEHAGDFPVFHWMVNGVGAGINSPVFEASGLQDQDAVSCHLISSLQCLLENPVSSNILTLSADSCLVADAEHRMPHPLMSVFPNPSSGNIFVLVKNHSDQFALRVLNLHGQIMFDMDETHPSIPYSRELDLTHLPKGLYLLQLSNTWYSTTQKITLY